MPAQCIKYKFLTLPLFPAAIKKQQLFYINNLLDESNSLTTGHMITAG